MSGCYVSQTQYKPIIRTLYAICQDAMSHRLCLSPWYGRYMPYVRMHCPTYSMTIIRTLYAICQNAMSHILHIRPLYGRFMPYVRMLCLTDSVKVHDTDSICHLSGCYVPQNQYKPILHMLNAMYVWPLLLFFFLVKCHSHTTSGQD